MNSLENDNRKRPVRKTADLKASQKQSRDLEAKIMSKTSKPLMLPKESKTSNAKRVLSQEEFRTRVSQKAFELYETRRAITDVEDWIEAERLVNLQLLGEGTDGGTV